MSDPSGSPTSGSTGPVLIGSGPQHVHVGTAREEEHKRGEGATAAAAGDTLSAAVVLQWMQASEERSRRQMEQQQQRHEEEMAVHRQQIAELTARKTTYSAADAVPTPLSSFRHTATTRPAVRSIQFTPHSPVTPHTAASESEQVEQAMQALPVDESVDMKVMKDTLAMLKGFVDPFYADSIKDKGTTVVDFVEKVESALSDLLDNQPQYQLPIVRLLLRDGAMRWCNGKLKELKQTAEKDRRDMARKPLRWETDIRKPFIEAHTGTDTVELWLAKLSELRLGAERTRTPIELNNQFDSIARHVYPTLTVGDDRSELMLAMKYREIILLSNAELHEAIQYIHSPTTLRDWKTALARQWNAQEQIKAAERMVRAQAASPFRGRGGWRGGTWRGRGGGTSGSATEPAKAAAMNVDDGAGPEGEQYTEEGQQLSVAAGGSQRGGRGGGGGGGRGRGGATTGQRTEWTEEKKKLYENKRCFHCGGTGHMAKGCTNAPLKA